MKVLVTGAAGFIGAAAVEALLDEGHDVVGLDNINGYYDVSLKYARLARCGVPHDRIKGDDMVPSETNPRYRFVRMELSDRRGMARLFEAEDFGAVLNLAGQAGVRHSIEDPFSYVESNVVGFLNILECCRNFSIGHLVYASSSSVYGMTADVPYSESDATDCPASLYAATKKSDELMAYSYSHLFGIPSTGVRFFTVYGPWGRPDMAPWLFMHAILEGKPIRVFNNGNLERDFTYVDDIVGGLLHIVRRPPASVVPHAVYNIGHSCPVRLMDFIHVIERVTNRKAIVRMEGMQPGDVYTTYADTTRLRHDFGYSPGISIDEGIRRFYEWYRLYTGKND